MGYMKAVETGDTTLDQTSYTQISGMGLYPPADDYLAVFTMEVLFNSSPTANYLRVAIYVNGVVIANSEREIRSNSSLTDTNQPICTSAIVSPTAGQLVEARYIITSGDAYIGQKRELSLISADTNTIDFVTSDTNITSSSYQDIGMSRTPASGHYLLIMTTSAETPADEVGAFRVSVGGSAVTHTVRYIENESSVADTPVTVMIAAYVNPNGSQVVEVKAARISGSGNFLIHERSMILVLVNSGDITQATGTASDADSTTSAVQIDDMEILNPGAGNYLALFSSYTFLGTIGSSVETTYKMYNAGASESDLERIFEHEASIDNCYLPNFLSGIIVVATGTDDVHVYWHANLTDTRTIYERTLVILDVGAEIESIYPAIKASNTSGDTGTAITVDLPAGIVADDLLLIFIATDGDNTVTDWNGFTEGGSESNGTANSLHWAYKKATGSEGASIAITLSVSEPSQHIAVRIQGMKDVASQAPEDSTVAEASSSTPNPTTCTPTGGSKDYLWILLAGWDRNRTINSWEANFLGDRISSIGGGAGDCGVCISTRPETVATKDPGSITISTSDTWVAWCLAIHPPDAPGGGWTGKIIKVTDPTKILGVATSGITKVNKIT